MATIQGQAGPQVLQDGTTTTVRQGKTGELVVTDAHGRYQEATYRGNVYGLTLAAGAATAYTGAAGGTPLLSIHNPVGSGKNLVLLSVGFASRVAASAAGTVTLQLWSGISVTPTGTLTAPTNMLSQVNSGSVAVAGVNTALTSSTALTHNFPLFTYYWATAAGAFGTPGYFDPAGLFIVTPGTQLNLGATAALTSATYDAHMIWEEIAL